MAKQISKAAGNQVIAVGAVDLPISAKRVNGVTVVGADSIAGEALAVQLIAEAKRQAEARESYKDTLKRIEGMTIQSLNALRRDLQNALDEQNAIAKALGVSFTEYRANNSEADCIAVTVSLWRKMASAVELGFHPDYARPWAELSKLATKITKAEAKAGMTRQEVAEAELSAEVEEKTVTFKAKTPKAEPEAPKPIMEQLKTLFRNLGPELQGEFIEWCMENATDAVPEAE